MKRIHCDNADCDASIADTRFETLSIHRTPARVEWRRCRRVYIDEPGTPAHFYKRSRRDMAEGSPVDETDFHACSPECCAAIDEAI